LTFNRHKYDFSDDELFDAPRCDHGLDQIEKEWCDERREWLCPRCDPVEKSENE